MLCPICNAQVPDGTPYCPDCGSPLNYAPVGSTPTQPTYNQPGYGMPVPPVNQGVPNQSSMGYVTPMNGVPQNPYQYNQQTNPSANAPIQEKKGSKLPIIIVCALAAVALIVGLILILTNKDDKNKTEPTTIEITTTEATTETTTEATTTEATTEVTTEATTTEATTESTTENTTEATTEENPVLNGDLNDATANLHGTYELTTTASAGQSFTVEEMEEISGETYAMTLTINSGFCLVDASEMGAGQGLATIYVNDDYSIELIDGVETIYGTYDPETDTITLTMNGVDMIFEKVEE